MSSPSSSRPFRLTTLRSNMLGLPQLSRILSGVLFSSSSWFLASRGSCTLLVDVVSFGGPQTPATSTSLSTVRSSCSRRPCLHRPNWLSMQFVRSPLMSTTVLYRPFSGLQKRTTRLMARLSTQSWLLLQVSLSLHDALLPFPALSSFVYSCLFFVLLLSSFRVVCLLPPFFFPSRHSPYATPDLYYLFNTEPAATLRYLLIC